MTEVFKWDEHKRQVLTQLVNAVGARDAEGFRKVWEHFKTIYPSYIPPAATLRQYFYSHDHRGGDIGVCYFNEMRVLKGYPDFKRAEEEKYLRLYTPAQIYKMDKRNSKRTYETKEMKEYISENINSRFRH